jgi:hypothetical protein
MQVDQGKQWVHCPGGLTQRILPGCLPSGVHFQQSIDEAKRICPGIGIDGYNKYVNLRNGISS